MLSEDRSVRARTFEVVVPVYNEEDILEEEVRQIRETLSGLQIKYKFLFIENGSRDKTCAILKKICSEDSERMRFIRLPRPNIGLALSTGYLNAEMPDIISISIDWWSEDFFRRVLSLDGLADIIQGSKRLPESRDERPLFRRFLSWGLGRLLNFLFGYPGTDSRGIRYIYRPSVISIIEKCFSDGGMFDTELLIRSHREGLKIVEVPLEVREIRYSRNLIITKIIKNVFRLVLLRFLLLLEYRR